MAREASMMGEIISDQSSTAAGEERAFEDHRARERGDGRVDIHVCPTRHLVPLLYSDVET
jgi:hypothetical protein